MKKLYYFLFMIFMSLIFNVNVSAETTVNGVPIEEGDYPIEMGCVYNDGSSIHFNGAVGIDSVEIHTPDQWGFPGSLPIAAGTLTEMKYYGFVNDDWKWDCPLYITTDGKVQAIEDYAATYGASEVTKITNFTNTKPVNQSYSELNASESYCAGSCNEQFVYTEEEYTCSYTGDGGSLTVKGSGDKCTVTYPDGTNSGEITNGVCGYFSHGCPDLYYNKRINKIEPAMYDYNDWFEIADHYDSDMHDFLCGNDKDNVEYYCAGSCEFPGNKSIQCEKLDGIINGAPLDTDIPNICEQEGVLKSVRFIGYILLIVKIVIPILLIVFGSIDFAKVIINSKPDDIQKTAKTFAYRVAAGVIIFLLPTVVNFVFEMLPSSTGKYENCRICLYSPNECQTIVETETD